MLKDTKSLGNNKAPACESRGFVLKKEGVLFDTPSYLKKRRLKNFSIDNTTNHPLLSTYWLSDDKQWVLIKQAFLFLSHAIVQSFNH